MDKKNHARILYLTTGLSQREIALEVGVSERTIQTWIHQYAWNKLRIAAQQAPATIIENFNSQIVEMQNAIAQREVGKRFPDSKEADVFRKLVNAAGSMKKTVSLPQSMQMMECFREFVRPLNKQFTEQLAHYADRFFSAKAVNGDLPYQTEYGVDSSVAVAPFYDELNGTEPCDKENPPAYRPVCTDLNDCASEHCNWPKCKFQDLTEDDAATTEIDVPWAPIEAELSTKIGEPEIPQFDPESTRNLLKINEQHARLPIAGFAPQPAETGSNPAISDLAENQQFTRIIEPPGSRSAPANEQNKLSPELEAYWLELKKQIAPQDYGLSDASLARIDKRLAEEEKQNE